MKKCKGCGVKLQNDDPKKTGYVTSIEQDYCQRCFRLTHYGDTKSLDFETINNDETYKIYDNYKKEIYILIIDAFDALCLDKDNLLGKINITVKKDEKDIESIKDLIKSAKYSEEKFGINDFYKNEEIFL